MNYSDTIRSAANTISDTISDTSRRFDWLEGVEGDIESLIAISDSNRRANVLIAANWAIEFGGDQRPTPCGSVELWGSIVQALDY
jgi:hypothetical protein